MLENEVEVVTICMSAGTVRKIVRVGNDKCQELDILFPGEAEVIRKVKKVTRTPPSQETW